MVWSSIPVTSYLITLFRAFSWRTPGDPRPATTSTPTGHALRRSLFPSPSVLPPSQAPPSRRRHSPHLSTPLDDGAVTAVAAPGGSGDSDKADNALEAPRTLNEPYDRTKPSLRLNSGKNASSHQIICAFHLLTLLFVLGFSIRGRNVLLKSSKPTLT